mmetsp:Transcript_16308/g.18395  ORF Transcript_16308/g.18395 Transcript_16308/m.18395 type:complete len:274 (+) Transcript_16308:838-1659(+)|eukprot:CAMPEP_0114990158 /NCGR_PEP_ID=MMETSP0216-20121206/10627_1 /TAXON_ID=223996 /ORGANISM="Protocruzia adherens, Strain Boccale" /LENGTH=273 /DNA_ID=CAMNT_0002353275 /DNA_START=957 /DNA_END=1778 /DNA_ORIENTATION=+
MCNSFETLKENVNCQNQENVSKVANQIENELAEAKGKWKPYRAHNCGDCDCQELRQLFHGIAYSMFYHIGASKHTRSIFSTINLNSGVSDQKSKYEKMMEQFCEYDDIMSRRTYAEFQKRRLVKLPEVDEIKDFLERMYTETRIFKEILVCAYIFIERLVERTKCTLTPTTWRIILMFAVHISLKMETDKYIPLQKLRAIYPLLKSSRYHELEIIFLELINYRCVITSEDYFKTLGKLIRNSKLYDISKPGSSTLQERVKPFGRREGKLNTIA